MNSTEKPRVDVAVAVVFNPAGQALWACRPEGKPYAGYWEFPGGKLEQGETVWQALVRELKEELNITATQGGPWFRIEHDYEHANVRLHLYRVWAFEGDLKPLEQQLFTWAYLNDSRLAPILPATEPLLSRLAQPTQMALTSYGQGFEACANRLEKALRGASTPVYVQFREKDLKPVEMLQAFEHCRTLCAETGHPLLLNSGTWIILRERLGELPCSLHLTEQHLLSGQFADLSCTGASVHSAESMQLAFQRGLDYAVLGAVHATASHPGQQGMGWKRFREVAEAARLPVFAIGGLSPADLLVAQQHGAHGVAMLSRFS